MAKKKGTKKPAVKKLEQVTPPPVDETKGEDTTVPEQTKPPEIISNPNISINVHSDACVDPACQGQCILNADGEIDPTLITQVDQLPPPVIQAPVQEQPPVQDAPPSPIVEEELNPLAHPWDKIDKNAFYLYPKRDWDDAHLKKKRKFYRFATLVKMREYRAAHHLGHEAGYACIDGKDLIKKYQFVLMHLRNVTPDDREYRHG